MAPSTKKMKTVSQALDGFEDVRKHIVACPGVAEDHPAIIAALKGLDTEAKRLERDAKLKQRFFSDAVAVEKPMESKPEDPEGLEASRETTTSVSQSAESADSDWQELNAEDEPEEDSNSSYLGKKLAKDAVGLVAQSSCKVSTPLGAIAVVLHAALLSLEFSCTGIPEEESSSNGFAKPVRALSLEQFVPAGWETKTAGVIRLRYRKTGSGSVALHVSEECRDEVRSVSVALLPSSHTEQNPVLSFPLSDHINLDSWRRAQSGSASIAPALHYRSLSLLLTNFARSFDLGPVDSPASIPYVDTTIAVGEAPQKYLPNGTVTTERYTNARGGPPTIDDAFGLRQGSAVPVGDFAGDLAPGGLVMGPQFGRVDPGNVMGPNHPMFQPGGFQPGGLSGIGPGSGFGMQPRFDPIHGPPGGPADVRGRRSSGEPNPDHLRPPNNLNNMFL